MKVKLTNPALDKENSKRIIRGEAYNGVDYESPPYFPFKTPNSFVVSYRRADDPRNRNIDYGSYGFRLGRNK